MGVSLLTKLHLGSTFPFATSWQIFWMKDAGSTGLRALKNITIQVSGLARRD
jgi:hypothetical protein